MTPETADASYESRPDGSPARPGLLVVFSGASPRSIPLVVPDGGLLIGRGSGVGLVLEDDRLSRDHARIVRTESEWVVRDLGSRNGTFVDGEQVRGEVRVASPRVIRVGDTLLVPCDDTTRALPASSERGVIVGQRLRDLLRAIDRAAAASDTLLVLGESGTGKELAARRFHERGPHAGGPFVAVNAATIPSGLAERILFGAKRGAYTGSEDAVGHLQAAHGGVLFLDEAAELDPQVQAKLLRVLETREVVPLGASRGTQVSLRICLATHGDLRAAVAAGKFRADLYHRIAPPEVVLPPLRDRVDEIAAHVVDAIAAASPGLAPHAKLVEACLLRPWPGNVRELRKQLHHAALHAASEGADRARIEHLPEAAGRIVTAPHAPVAAPAPASAAPEGSPLRSRRTYVRWSQSLTREQIERALEESPGNLAHAARTLGMQRSQLYRELERFAIKPRS